MRRRRPYAPTPRAAFTAILALALGAAPVSAACRQDRAIYEDATQTITIRFAPVPEEAAITHGFTVTAGTLSMAGYVMLSDPAGRHVGRVEYNCPEGDVTGTDLAACRVWEGPVYGHQDGVIGPLPDAGRTAARELLLAGFGDGMATTPALAGARRPSPPWDVFTLSGCAQ